MKNKMKAELALEQQMLKSNGSAKVVKVPKHMRPTRESLKNLETEIASQIEANEIMRNKSIQKASQQYK